MYLVKIWVFGRILPMNFPKVHENPDFSHIYFVVFYQLHLWRWLKIEGRRKTAVRFFVCP